MRKAEEQYLSLYAEAEPLLRENSTDVMNALRSKAMDDFRRLGFPSKKVERYKYTDVAEAFAPDYGVNLRRVVFPMDPYKAYRCSVPNIGTALYYVVNDMFYASPVAKHTVLPDGVYVGSLRDYDAARPGELAQYYGRLAATANDGLTALNTALAQDALLIRVARNVQVEPTLQVVNLMRSDVNLLTSRRVLLIVEDGAAVNLLFCEHSVDKRPFLTTAVTEAFVGEGSRLCLYGVEETEQQNRLFENIYINLKRQSRLEYAQVTLHNGLTRCRLDCTFDGEGSEARVMGAVVAGRDQRVDNNLLIDHKTGRCRSDVLYKYVLDDHSRGAFAGKVLVRQDAQRTDSQETNANLCVSPEARMFTQPMLEIYADDVKCNHGSTVGQLDQTALFYMAQRGIRPEEARLLLQHAFVNEVIQQIRLEPLRERLSVMVEHRFRHGAGACGDCNLCGNS